MTNYLFKPLTIKINKKKTTMEDNNINVFNILNLYIEEYNKKNGKNNNMFENIDINDETSTNSQMEQFFEYMTIHNELKMHNPSYIEIYEPENYLTPTDVNVSPHYLIIDGNIKFISLSYLSLLCIVEKEKFNEWKIVQS